MTKQLKNMLRILKDLGMDSTDKIYDMDEIPIEVIEQINASEDFVDKLSNLDKEMLILWLNRYNMPQA